MTLGPAIKRLVGFCFETEVDRLRLVATDSHILRLRSVILMPRSHGVLSRRQVGQRKPAAIAADGIVAGFQNCKPTVHPGMNVALYGNKLWLIELVLNRR